MAFGWAVKTPAFSFRGVLGLQQRSAYLKRLAVLLSAKQTWNPVEGRFRQVLCLFSACRLPASRLAGASRNGKGNIEPDIHREWCHVRAFQRALDVS